MLSALRNCRPAARVIALSAATPTLACCGHTHQRRFNASGTAESEAAAAASSDAQFPVIQLPARSLWCRQYDLKGAEVTDGVHTSMIDNIIATRRYYQYPSMSAPQIGWNVRAFVLWDGTVFINPEVVEVSELHCWAWEPCASCAFLMHFIRRPKEVVIRHLDRSGRLHTTHLNKMRARMALHEMDHLDGILFTRRIPDTQHVVPLDGFNSMSDWPDDFPSLEARSTFLYSTFTPPYYFESDDVFDANMLDRKFEDGIYPGHEHDSAVRVHTQAYLDSQKSMWQHEKESWQDVKEGEVPATMPEAVAAEGGDSNTIS